MKDFYNWMEDEQQMQALLQQAMRNMQGQQGQQGQAATAGQQGQQPQVGQQPATEQPQMGQPATAGQPQTSVAQPNMGQPGQQGQPAAVGGNANAMARKQALTQMINQPGLDPTTKQRLQQQLAQLG